MIDGRKRYSIEEFLALGDFPEEVRDAVVGGNDLNARHRVGQIQGLPEGWDKYLKPETAPTEPQKKPPTWKELADIIEAAVTESFAGTGGVNPHVVRTAYRSVGNRIGHTWQSKWRWLK